MTLRDMQSNRAPRASFKRRRQEIERRFAAHGLLRPREPLEQPSRKLRQALESLGPVFSTFGLYLSSRADLFPAEDCLTLSALPNWVPAMPLLTVRDLIAAELHNDPEMVYAVFEDTPYESCVAYQSHRAVLHTGEHVLVKVTRPETQLTESLTCDLELLSVVGKVLSQKTWGGLSIEDAIADFRVTLHWQQELRHEIQAIQAMLQDTHTSDMLRVPRVYPELCTARLRTIEHVAGINLEALFMAWETQGSGHVALSGIKLGELARRLCLLWLRQALLGTQCPVEWRPTDIVLLPNKQFSFTGGVFAALPSETKKNLWHYLTATAGEDPDKACAYLLQEMTHEDDSLDEDELRHRFREIVPFRDGGWERSGTSNSLAEHLFLQWRLMRERGLRPRPPLLGFTRGLFRTVAMTRRITQEGDPLSEGLQDVRTVAIFYQFRDMMELDQIGDSMDQYTALAMGMPQRLNEALAFGADAPRMRPQSVSRSTRHEQAGSSAGVVALLLVLAAVVLVSHHLAASAIAGVWIERMSAIVFVSVGALLLRAASR